VVVLPPAISSLIFSVSICSEDNFSEDINPKFWEMRGVKPRKNLERPYLFKKKSL
jgi:hypothetical protein